MIELNLTRNKTAIIDDEDSELKDSRSWLANKYDEIAVQRAGKYAATNKELA